MAVNSVCNITEHLLHVKMRYVYIHGLIQHALTTIRQNIPCTQVQKWYSGDQEYHAARAHVCESPHIMTCIKPHIPNFVAVFSDFISVIVRGLVNFLKLKRMYNW